MKKLAEYQRKLRRYATSWEKIFKKELRKWCGVCGVNFEFQKVFWTGERGYIADFYLADYRVIFELDGKHHLVGEQLEDDRVRDAWFKAHSIEVVRVQNSELDERGAAEIIDEVLRGRKKGRIRVKSKIEVRKRLEKQCRKVLDKEGREITICPEITKGMLEKKKGRRRKGKAYKSRKEVPGTFQGSIFWKC